MQRTVRLKLTGPVDLLDAPAQAFAHACDHLANEVHAGRCRPNALTLQKTYYTDLRQRFGLMAQVACSATRHVAGTYATLKANGHTGRVVRFKTPFLKLLHQREWRLKDSKLVLSIPGHRGGVAFDCDARSVDVGRLLCGEPGGATLIKRGTNYYLNVCVDVPDVPLQPALVPIGIDRGIRTLAVARAPGKTPLVIRGGYTRDYRARMARLRQRLQAKGTRSAKRVLRRLRTREQQFILHQARLAAKHTIQYALRHPGAVLVLEDLTGLRERARTRTKMQRRDLNAWAYRVYQQALLHKAEEHGLPHAFINPAYTSRTCPRCGDARAANRRGSTYGCLNCGYRNHADIVGATNTGRAWTSSTLSRPRGPVNGPHERVVEGRLAEHAPPETTLKPPTSVGGG